MKEKLIKIEKFSDSRGSLSVCELAETIGFLPKRIYYIYNVPVHATRAGHGHMKLKQFFIPISGLFSIKVSDGHDFREYELSSRDYGLLVPDKYWRELYDFSADAVCLVLASEVYDTSDYIFEYENFCNEVRKL